MKEIGLILILAIMLVFFNAATQGKDIKSDKFIRASLGPELIQNDSTYTGCPEDDNINIPLYYKNLAAFRVIATHPTYIPTNVKDGGANCSPCCCGPKCISHFAIFNPMTNETVQETPIYKTEDGNITITGVKEIPWRTSAKMNVSVSGNRNQYEVVYFVIYKRIEGLQSWPQVFVLYQDRNARIKPQSLPCMNDTTFGSSVIIGATEFNDIHPVNISSVVIDPINLSMDIKYVDNTSAHIEMQVNCIENIVELSNITYDTTSHSFARIRSMWVKDGNADVDHIRTEDGEFPIMGGWNELNGTWGKFLKKIPSIHNTYCPDIAIEIVPKNKFPKN